MKKLLLQACLAMTAGAIHAQVGIGTATPHASAQLEINATGKGLLVPRMTQANRPASPATGLMIYQTDNTPGYYYYDGSSWNMLGGSTNAWNLDGNSGTTAAHFIGTTDAMPLVFKVNGVRSGYIDNDASGSLALFGLAAGRNNTTGVYNSAFGYGALLNNTIGNYNTAIGAWALLSNNTGHNNTAVGSEALYMNTNIDNTAVGSQALRTNTTGFGNTALGKTALYGNSDGVNNTAIGSTALFANSSGSSNTAVGCVALANNISGHNNTAIGLYALYDLQSGDYNTAVGYEAGSGLTGFSNTTSIGYGAKPTGNDMVRIGNDDVQIIGGVVGWSQLSDIRFKKDIAPQPHGLDFIMQLQPITYHFDTDKLNGFKADSNKSNKQQNPILYSGFSAQQVEEAAKSLGYDFSGVHRPQNDKDHYSLDYASFVVPLVKAMQEQQDMISELKKQNELLQQQINSLKQALRQ